MDPKEIERAMVLYKEAVPLTVGQATISWNTLTGAIFDIYSALSEMDSETAKATFFAVASDRSQRDMTGSLVEIRLKPKNTGLAKKANTLLGKANSLAGRRNDILHVVYINSLSPEKVSQLHQRGHLKDKTGADLLSTIHAFTMECLDLAIAFGELRAAILGLTHYRGLTLAEALLRYIPQRTPEELASQGLYDFLNAPATKPPSSPETQENE